MAYARAFSLVQMLVVIGILGLLIALLIPAIQRAAHQASLAACASHLESIASGANTYAVQFNRRYPVLPRLPWPHLQGWNLRRPDYVGNGGPDDFRPLVAGHIAPDHLVCPLAPKISLDPADTGTTQSYSNYALWMGWRYTPPGGHEEGMITLGEDWTWNGTRFRVLAGDIDFAYPFDAADTTHPDDDGVLMPVRGPDAEFPQMTASFYSANKMRGRIDMNNAHHDGSVHRMADVRFRDPRTKPVPMGSTPDDVDHGSLFVPPR